MKFVFLSEGDTHAGTTHEARYHELVEQVVYAERWGFDCFGVSEQHLAIGSATTASPEVLYGYLYGHTSRIRFRHAISLIPVNHPLKIAANVAVADILSHGRIELGVGRGNTTLALRAFEIDLDRSRLAVKEGIEIIRKAFTEDPFMFYGEYYKIPPRSLVPKTIQKPHPPMFVAASSRESHEVAARAGIGVMSVSSSIGWQLLADNIAAYRRAFDAANGTPSVGVLVNAYCGETDEVAKAEGGPSLVEYMRVAYTGYTRLAKMSKDYAYMGAFGALGDRIVDYDYIVNDSGAVVIGSPETCIRQIEHYRSLGATEMILRIDSVPHDRILRSIELFGKYVIPHFKHPENIVRPSEEILGDIRRMRDVAKAQGVYVELTEPGQGQKSAGLS